MSILDDPILQQFLNSHSNHSVGHPVAVFDCDGTLIKGDIGEAMLFDQIEQFHFRVSPATVWQDHPRRDELDRMYRALSLAEPTRRARHSEFDPFAQMILSWYFGQIADGKVEKACADIVRLFAGFTSHEVRAIAEETFLGETSAPLSERTLGGKTRPRGVRYITETVAVLRKLQELRFEIWVVSGSNRWSVESVVRRLGISPERVIGIDLVEERGVLGSTVIEPVPISEKKIDALKTLETRVPLLVASDSRLDVPLLLYAAELKIFVNSRRKRSSDFFELTHLRPDDSWVVVERPTILEGVPNG